MNDVPRAVADVNVLVSAARTPNGVCGRLLEAAIDGRWQPVVSATLFAELEEVFSRRVFKDLLGQEAIDRFLAGLIAIVEWAEDPPDAAAVPVRDPDDAYLLALARNAGVDVLVSGDRDLTELADPQLPVETPSEFAQRLA